MNLTALNKKYKNDGAQRKFCILFFRTNHKLITINFTAMSKDKISKDKKKAPSEGVKKAPSDYQSGKSSSKIDIGTTGKKK